MKLNKYGFTLIELTVAVAILGVLTLIAIPSVRYIQANNQKTKYMAYEKAIKSASKAYVDSYDEDLFGSTNSGCATVTYSDLKEKDLVEDIQVKGIKCDKDDDTFIYVIKTKNGNHGYFSNIICRNGSEVVYSNKEDKNRTDCKLEDGNGPEAKAVFEPEQGVYHIGDTPKAKLTLTDTGVGLKENQVLYYVWILNGKELTDVKPASFSNENSWGYAERYIDMPTDLSTINDSINYTLKVTGKVYDMNNNMSEVKIEKPLTYFVGTLTLQLNANGGSIGTSTNMSKYEILSGGDIKFNGSLLSYKLKYKGKMEDPTNLADANSATWLNLIKTGYHIKNTKEWNTKPDGTGTSYDQTKTYETKDFYDKTSPSLKTTNQDMKLYANWEINTYKLTYSNTCSTDCNSQNITKTHGAKWGTVCTPKCSGHKFAGWKVGTTTYTVEQLGNLTATSDVKATAVWDNDRFVTIYFNANGGSIDSRNGKYTLDSSGKIKDNGAYVTRIIPYGKSLSDTDYSDLPDANSSKYINLTKTGHSITATDAWKKSDGSKTFDQTKSYPASDFCDASKNSCDVTLYANWKANTYRLTYDDNGGTGCGSANKYIDKKYNEKWGTLCTPSRSGYTFGGWYKDSTKIDSNSTVTGSIKVTAKWTAVPQTIYKLTYDDNGGTGCASKYIEKNANEAWGTLCTPSKDGNTFGGWYKDSTQITSSSKATANIKVTAKWTVNTVTIYYNANGGSLIDKHGEGYSIASDGTIKKDGNNLKTTVKYGESLGTSGLANYDSSSYLHIARAGYHLDDDSVWKNGNTTYDQTTQYAASKFCDAKTASCSVTLSANWKKTTKKPNKPTIDNSSGEKWTNKDVTLTVSVSGITANKVGQWWYKWGSGGTLYKLNDADGNSSIGQTKFKPPKYTAEQDRTIYVRVCSTGATSSTDSNNCSDFATSGIHIDKTPPVMYTVNKGSFVYSPTLRKDPRGSKNVSSTVTINDIDCKKMADADKYYKADICRNWYWKYKKVPKNNGEFWWGWDDIVCHDDASGCKKEYWYWAHDSNQSEKWCKWNQKIGKDKYVSKNCGTEKEGSNAYNHYFYAGNTRPSYKEGQAYAYDKAGNKSEVFKYRLDVSYG